MAEQKNITRELFLKVADHLKEPEITLITGARQVGKTVLLNALKDWLIKDKKVSSGKILYFNLDLVKDREFFLSQGKFIEYLESRCEKGKLFVFVDEAQKTPECPLFFKGVYDSKLPVKLILTGSSFIEIKAKLKESLAGRKRIFQLNPFSFTEFLTGRAPESASLLKNGGKIPELQRKLLVKLFNEYLIWGGYPRVALEKNPENRAALLSEIYSSYVEKDIIGFMEIKNWMNFSKLLKLLAGQIGSLINIAELTNSSNLDRETVERYIKILHETFIVNPVLPYYKNSRQEIIKQQKIYFQDIGLRNYATENYSAASERGDNGFLMENVVFQEIQKALKWTQKTRFWRTKQGAEVDFVIIEKENDLLPIEVKFNVRKPAISLGLRSFIEKYRPSKALLINLHLFDRAIKIGQTKIHFIHPYELVRYI